MKKKLMILFGTAVLFLLATNFVSAQNAGLEKRIKLVRGQKLVLKGDVYKGDDFYYNFKSRKGQTLTSSIYTFVSLHPANNFLPNGKARHHRIHAAEELGQNAERRRYGL